MLITQAHWDKRVTVVVVDRLSPGAVRYLPAGMQLSWDSNMFFMSPATAVNRNCLDTCKEAKGSCAGELLE